MMFWILQLLIIGIESTRSPTSSSSSPTSLFGIHNYIPRGGSSKRYYKDDGSSTSSSYELLATVVQDKFSSSDDQSESIPSTTKLAKTLSKLASSQQTFKGLDGAAHEAYRRTHTTSGDIIDTSVCGRAQRSAQRLAAVAEGLYACELIEIVERPQIITQQQYNETFREKKIILNLTTTTIEDDNTEVQQSSNVTLAGRPMSILVIYEPMYDGGAGLDHGTLLFAPSSSGNRPPKGRLIDCIRESILKRFNRNTSNIR